MADLHLSHANIIKYCKRPFENVNEMNVQILGNLREIASEDNVLFMLGDIFFETDMELLEEFGSILKEFKTVYIIPGNHDHTKTQRLIARFTKPKHPKINSNILYSENDIMEISIEDDEMAQAARLILCHYPIARWNAQYHGSWHLFGHTHRTYQHPSYNAIDVGIDNWNYKPISYNKVKEIITTQNLDSKYLYGN